MKRVRWIILTVILVPILVVAGFLLIRYIRATANNESFLLPRLEQVTFNVEGIDGDSTKVLAKALVTNPLPFRITADSIAYKIYMSDSLIVQTTYRSPISVKPGDSTWLNFPVAIYSNKLESLLERLDKEGLDSVYYEIKAAIYTRQPVHRRFDVDDKRKYPLVYIPEVKVTRVQLDSVRLSHIVLLVHARVVNKNVFPINAKALTYRVAVAGNPWVEGGRPGLTDIPPKSVTEVVFPVRLSLKEVGESVIDIIKKGRNIDYKFEMTMTAKSHQRFLDGSQFVFRSHGIVEHLVDAVTPDKKEKKEKKKSKK